MPKRCRSLAAEKKRLTSGRKTGGAPNKTETQGAEEAGRPMAITSNRRGVSLSQQKCQLLVSNLNPRKWRRGLGLGLFFFPLPVVIFVSRFPLPERRKKGRALAFFLKFSHSVSEWQQAMMQKGNENLGGIYLPCAQGHKRTDYTACEWQKLCAGSVTKGQTRRVMGGAEERGRGGRLYTVPPRRVLTKATAAAAAGGWLCARVAAWFGGAPSRPGLGLGRWPCIFTVKLRSFFHVFFWCFFACFDAGDAAVEWLFAGRAQS